VANGRKGEVLTGDWRRCGQANRADAVSRDELQDLPALGRVRSSATNAIGAQQRNAPQAAQEVQGGRRRRGHRVDLTRDITPAVDEIYPLCLQVYERSKLRFERLTGVYLPARRRDAGPGVLLVRRRRGKAVAFGMCLVHGDTQYAEYLGLRRRRCTRPSSLSLSLRFPRSGAGGIANGDRWFQSTGLNYDPKLHLRHRLKPVDLYVRHTYPSSTRSCAWRSRRASRPVTMKR
jgi:hypothetical protein